MRFPLALLLLLIGFAVFSGLAKLPEDSELVSRMRARTPKLAKLLLEGEVGEGLTGFLLPVSDGSSTVTLSEEDKSLVDAENSDRNALYGLLAKSNEVPASQIATTWAEQIRAILSRELTAWYQEPDGRDPKGFRWMRPGVSGDKKGSFVWTKPKARILKEPSASAESVNDNVPGFSSYLVTKTEAVSNETWYQVAISGPAGTPGQPQVLGWMKETEVLPQPHRLVASFANDANRDKLVIFRQRENVISMAGLPAEKRATEYDQLWDESQSVLVGGKTPRGDFPVVAIEPDVSPEIFKTFYVMPVLQADPMMIDKTPARVVKLACATMQSSGPVKTEAVDVDVVFIVDTTGSMQPFINQVVGLCRQMAQSLQDGKTRYRFGCWGYQDSTKKKGIQYLTKNFTPTLLPVAQFTDNLSEVKANIPTEDEYEEALLDGVLDAVTKTNWRPNAGRLAILVGDAPPLERTFQGDFEGNGKGLDLKGVRLVADTQRVNIFAINIQDPGYKSYHKKAERTYSALSTNRGATSAAFYPVAGGSAEAFGQVAGTLINTAIAILRMQAGEQIAMPQVTKEYLEKVDFLLKPLVRDIASKKQDKQAPSFEIGWALNRGFKKTNSPIFEVCVVATRAELDSCVKNLTPLMESGQNGTFSSKERYENVQKLILQVFYPNLTSTKDQLPYDSKILKTSFEELQQKSPQELTEFWDLVEAKVNGMREKQSENCWAPIHENATPDEEVTAIPLDGIP
jgi:serine/threonine-protein kinase PpkA